MRAGRVFRLAVIAACAAGLSAAASPDRHAAHHQADEQRDGLDVVDDGEDRYELILAGRRFTSRDRIEGYLLYRAATLAREHGQDWFVLLHLPGEQPDTHPERSNPEFGARYGHWQPHWSYLRDGEGWQPWHPEWGAPFWAERIDPAGVARFEVHAMIRIGRGAPPRETEAVFDARRVATDLEAGYSRPQP